MKSGFVLNLAFCGLLVTQSLRADDQPDAEGLWKWHGSDAKTFLETWYAKDPVTGTQRVDFERYHAAPNVAQVTFSKGVATFNDSNESLLYITEVKRFNGMLNNSPTYATFPDQYGEYREFDGERILEFDRTNKICRISSLSKECAHHAIAPHPFPLIFTRSALEAQSRFHLRQVDWPSGVVVIEGYPKHDCDKDQFTMFRACFDEESYEIRSLVVYGPRFHPIKNPVYDHYTFEHAGTEKATGLTGTASRPIDPNSPPPDWRIVSESAVNK